MNGSEHDNLPEKAKRRPLPPAPKGNQRGLTHGAHAVKPPGLDEARQEIYDWLEAAAPVRGAQGQLPPADEPIVEAAARALARFRALDDWVAEHGFVTKRGRLSSPAIHLERVQKNLTDLLAHLGMTPRSRAALGVDLARTVDLATAMSEPDPDKRSALLKQAGVGGTDE